jgi:long-chain-fatty-acid--[acyl-carrier-protein] ligase
MVQKAEYWKRLIAIFFFAILSLRYKVRIKGKEILRNGKIKLFLPNHTSLVDAIMLTAYFSRYENTSPAVTEAFFTNPFFKFFFKITKAIRVSDLESGNRDLNVLNYLTEKVSQTFAEKRNVLIYPAGQITANGIEKIGNKQGVYRIVNQLPENVSVIGVRVTGLWGSMWTKAKTGKRPDFLKTLLKGILFVFANLIFFVPRRKVDIELIEITQNAIEMVAKDRKSFNSYLEAFYNVPGIDCKIRPKYFFYT